MLLNIFFHFQDYRVVPLLPGKFIDPSANSRGLVLFRTSPRTRYRRYGFPAPSQRRQEVRELQIGVPSTTSMPISRASNKISIGSSQCAHPLHLRILPQQFIHVSGTANRLFCGLQCAYSANASGRTRTPPLKPLQRSHYFILYPSVSW